MPVSDLSSRLFGPFFVGYYGHFSIPAGPASGRSIGLAGNRFVGYQDSCLLVLFLNRLVGDRLVGDRFVGDRFVGDRFVGSQDFCLLVLGFLVDLEVMDSRRLPPFFLSSSEVSAPGTSNGSPVCVPFLSDHSPF